MIMISRAEVEHLLKMATRAEGFCRKARPVDSLRLKKIFMQNLLSSTQVHLAMPVQLCKKYSVS